LRSARCQKGMPLQPDASSAVVPANANGGHDLMTIGTTYGILRIGVHQMHANLLRWKH